MVEADAQLQVKKRARRRLVGAVAFAAIATIVLPVVMDQEPRLPVQDVDIRIPGQDEKPFNPRLKLSPAETPAPVPAAEASPPPVERPVIAPPPPAAPVASPAPEPKPGPEKKPEKTEKPAKPEKSAKNTDDDSKRAAAILSGKANEPTHNGSSYAILIGAFSNTGNVKNLQQKLTEQGIKTWTEQLDTPSGQKTRVRAGPFSSKEAAEKALDKMKRIGVAGVIAGK